MPSKALPSIVTLTTDFGLSDHYVGVMKGVILGICSSVRIVDITHDCRPFDIAGTAFTIAQTYRYFPPRTVHVVVVDPGVGTKRKPILVQAAGQFFVGPDNGVFNSILSRENYRVRVISNERYFFQPVSQTFHGRDVFASVAAHLAGGISPARIGEVIGDYPQPKSLQPVLQDNYWTGIVLKIDHFGNIVTSFPSSDFPSGGFVLLAGRRKVTRLASNYEQFAHGELFAIAGSSGFIEISARQESAAKLLGIAPGGSVTLRIPQSDLTGRRRSIRLDS